ncbi:MAG: hypothetical protein ACK2UM_02740 [Anaerolineales bacterium]|jgi:hypothetical protein
MKFTHLLKGGISLKKQKAGSSRDGPLGPAFGELSRTSTNRLTGSGDQPAEYTWAISPVGMDLVSIFANRSLWVLFAGTDGSGIVPWRGLIVLDSSYQGEGQTKSPATLGMVAHELTHLLQRELNQPHCWPGGGFNPVLGRRWIGDSTNYMEVIAYLVGWTVEYDFTLASKNSLQNLNVQKSIDNNALASIRNRLALLSKSEAHRTSKIITELFPENAIYRQNMKAENRYPDRRVPPGNWHIWLRQMGFSRGTIDHIMVLASQKKN